MPAFPCGLWEIIIGPQAHTASVLLADLSCCPWEAVFIKSVLKLCMLSEHILVMESELALFYKMSPSREKNIKFICNKTSLWD